VVSKALRKGSIFPKKALFGKYIFILKTLNLLEIYRDSRYPYFISGIPVNVNLVCAEIAPKVPAFDKKVSNG